MITLKINEKGHLIELPGVAHFRSPAKVNISNIKLPLIITTLNNLGVRDYEIISREGDKEKIYTKKDFEKPKKKKKEDLTKINERFNKIEKLLYALAKKDSKKHIPEEQITNKLKVLEELSQRILEKESIREIVYTSSKDTGKTPIIEELDEDTFIPTIDISDLKLKGGSSSEKIGEIEGAEEAADLLSRLKG